MPRTQEGSCKRNRRNRTLEARGTRGGELGREGAGARERGQRVGDRRGVGARAAAAWGWSDGVEGGQCREASQGQCVAWGSAT